MTAPYPNRPGASHRLPSLLLAVVLLVSTVANALPWSGAGAAPPAIVSDWLGFDFVNGVTPEGKTYGVSEQRYRQATDSGGRWTRWPMYWNQIEANRGVADYSAQDAVVNADVARGLQVNAILVGTPGWAASTSLASVGEFDVSRKRMASLAGPVGDSPPGLPSDDSPRTSLAGGPASVPTGLDLPILNGSGINPENQWARFVYQTVSRYRGRVSVWEIWNEPDLKFGATPVFWTGTPEQYARLLKVAYSAAKLADPSATVLFAGLQYWSTPDFFPRALDTLRSDPEANASGLFFDAVAVHPYISTANLVDFTVRVRRQMAARGISKPVWVNETNIPVCDDKSVDPALACPSQYRGTMDEQASYVVQTAALSAAMGIQRLLFFQLYDDNVGPSEWYGLVRNTGQPRPALSAFAHAARWLGRHSSANWRRSSSHDQVQLGGVMDGAQAVRVTVLWSRTAQGGTVSVPAAGGRNDGRLLDMFGAAAGGRLARAGLNYLVTLPGLTNADLGGGSPFYLIEPVDADTSAPSVTLSAADGCRGEPVSWQGIDGGWGAWHYDVEVQVGGSAAWSRWLSATQQTSAAFDGIAGQRYTFRARARDLAGNESGWSAGGSRTVRSCGGVQEAVRNGGFESGLSEWSTAGATPVQSGGGLSGVGAVLGSNVRLEPGQSFGNSTLRQTVTLPATRPRLEFSYRLDGAPCTQGWLEALLYTGAQLSTRIEYPIAPKTLREPTDWVRGEADLAAFAGQTVTIVFNVVNLAGSSPLVATLDGISIAPATSETTVLTVPGPPAVESSWSIPVTAGLQGTAVLTETRVVIPAAFIQRTAACS